MEVSPHLGEDGTERLLSWGREDLGCAGGHSDHLLIVGQKEGNREELRFMSTKHLGHAEHCSDDQLVTH